MLFILLVVILLQPRVEVEFKFEFLMFLTCKHIPQLHIQMLNAPQATWVCKHVPSKT